jgi:hypothetical protein
MPNPDFADVHPGYGLFAIRLRGQNSGAKSRHDNNFAYPLEGGRAPQALGVVKGSI